MEPSPKPIVHFHYMGHASFLLQFDSGVSVLTDYGSSNSYNLDSPVCDLAGFQPDIVTFSHSHPDHRHPNVDFEQTKVLTDMDRFSIRGLEISPIRTSESSIHTPDNSSYLFTYKGVKILHLADAQAYIMAIDQAKIREQVKELYPHRYDLLLMTIEGLNHFIPQAEAFIALLQPVRVIPMHYWSPKYKADFLAYLRIRNQQAGTTYKITETIRADYELYSESEATPIQVISLIPAPLPGTKES